MEKNTKLPFDSWQCPFCGYKVSDLEMQSVKFEPNCQGVHYYPGGHRECAARWRDYIFVPKVNNKKKHKNCK